MTCAGLFTKIIKTASLDNNSFHTFRLNAFQWATFHDLYNQLEKWVQDTERILVADVELKNTLPEKKAQLQHYRVSYLE